MERTEFHARADRLLEALESELEEHLDAELQAGILTIASDSGTFVLNKHEPTQQLWLSSPVSGAARFLPEGGGWHHAVTEEPLYAMLERELGIAGLEEACS